MLRWRLAAAAAILIPLVALLVVDFRWHGGAPGIWLVAPGLAIAWAAAAEVLDLTRAVGVRPVGWTVYTGVALIFLAACVPMFAAWWGKDLPPTCPLGAHGLVLSAACAALAIAFAGEMSRFQAPGGAIMNLSAAVFAVIYVGFALSFAASLRQFHDNAWGMTALISVVFVMKWSDTGAYFVGKSWGRHKLAPRLSPGKTVEGAVGGMVAAALASWVYFRFVAPALTGDAQTVRSVAGTALYGMILGAVGLVGDLGESLLKRDAQRKDSSRWLPGLGGVLDVMDSLFFAMPAAYVCWSAGLVGPAALGD